MTRRTAWPVLLVVLLVALAFGSFDSGGKPQTAEQRVDSIAAQIRCPTCSGLSVAESDSPLAQSSQEEIERQVTSGRTDAQIRAYFVSRYGETALISPERKGLGRAVWMIPIVFGAAAIAAIVVRVRRWRAQSEVRPSDEDRALVDSALGRNP